MINKLKASEKWGKNLSDSYSGFPGAYGNGRKTFK